MSKIKLFCVPYAGGAAVIFEKWLQYLDPRIELKPIELAGRGKRFREALYKDSKAVIDDVFQIMEADVKNNRTYAVFGHSMGGKIAYEVAQRIRRNNLNKPAHVFFSGRGAPHVKRADRINYHLMEKKEFVKAISDLGGTPPEIFAHPELLELFLPMLRNDFKIAETEVAAEDIHPLDYDITVFLGKKDSLIAEECDGWKIHTTGRCTLHYFEGGHFFLHDEAERIVKVLNATLAGSA